MPIARLSKRTAKLEHRVYKHFDCSSWYKPEAADDDQHMVVMVTTSRVPRWTNRLPYDLKVIEDEVFHDDLQAKSQRNQSLTQQPFASVVGAQLNNSSKEEDNIISDFCSMMLNRTNATKYKEVTERDIADYQRAESIEDYVFQRLASCKQFIAFGSIYTTSYDFFKRRISHGKQPMDTHVTKEVIKELLIRIIPESSCYESDSGSEHSMWIELKCNKCHASCFVKKPSGHCFSEFLMKTIYSKWNIHVFGLDMQDNNNWNRLNKGWNMCNARKKQYFHTLKYASLFDGQRKMEQRQLQSYQEHSRHILSLCDLMYQHHTNIVMSTFTLGVAIREDLKLARLCRNKNYVQREKETLKDIGGTKSLIRKSKGPKTQTQEDIRHRQREEQYWSKEQYYHDLKLQLQFGKLMFVNPSLIPFEKLLPKSQEYVTYYSSDEYKQKKKKDPTVNPDFSHFLGITDTTKPPTNGDGGHEHIIEEDYFVNRNEFGKLRAINNRNVSKKTVDQCVSSPNVQIALKSMDKRLIKGHVDRLMCAGEIQSLKLLPEKEYETEVLTFEGKRYENKIRFSGVDSRNVRHLLSDDWIEINFKERTPAFYRRIMAMKNVNQTIQVPEGNRNSSGNKMPFTKKELGPTVPFPQTRHDSCLFCSVASAFHNNHEFLISHKIMHQYNILSKNYDFVPSFRDILDILRNKYRVCDEKKIRIDVRKGKYRNAEELINDMSPMVILVVLSNKHAVALNKQFIFDPAFKKALPRTIRALRFSAELEILENIDTSIKRVYLFSPFKK